MSLAFFPAQPAWDVQVMRLVAESIYGGADVFECARVAEQITARGSDEEAWLSEWEAIGDRLVAEAEVGLAAENPTHVTSRDALLRATNYFRTSELFAPHSDPRRSSLFDRAQSAFRRALPLLPIESRQIEIADGDVTYEGYVFPGRGVSAQAPGPGVVFLGGADSYSEELYSFGARALVDRGITVVCADTPGRGGTLRRKGIPTRPDYEQPTKRLVDTLVALDCVDPDRVGLVGLSLGGYYAPRLASADDRIKALVCWCACFDVLEDLYRYYPPIRPQLRWITGSETEEEAVDKLREFTLAPVAGEIRCPILISHGENDDLMPATSAERLYDAVASTDKTLKIWRRDEGGAMHCNYDNWAACIPFMFDWLQAKLASGNGSRA